MVSVMYGLTKSLLVANDARVKSDSAYQSALRLMQSLWRQERGLAAGMAGDKRSGSLLAMPTARDTLSNFLTPRIGELVTAETAGAGVAGKVYAIPRLYDNLLSSQPLCFNLFGELALDLDLATAVSRLRWPDAIDVVTSIEFQWRPDMSTKAPVDDDDVFDVAILHTTPSGGEGFVGFGVRYHENLRVRVRPQHDEHEVLAVESGQFRSREFSSLASPPLQQFWRLHLTAQSALREGQWRSGHVVLLYPSINNRCAGVAADYGRHLTEKAAFEALEMEVLVADIEACTDSRWIEDFRHRYLDYGRLNPTD